MPTKERIELQLTQLPILSEYERPGLYPEKVWAGNEHGGHFRFFGHTGFLWDPRNGEIIAAVGYTVSISGSDRSKEAISADFIAALGPPRRDFRGEIRRALGKRTGKITYLTWLQPEDDQVENHPSFGLLVRNHVEAYILDCVPKDTVPTLPMHRNILPPEVGL